MSDTTFAALGCSEALLAALAKRGFETPMPVQEQTIKPGLEGRDLLVQSRTGSGKTLAYGLPLLQRPEGKTLEFKRDLSSPEKVLHTLTSYLPFLSAELPVGHPLRGQAAVRCPKPG